MAAAHACQEALWLRLLLKELGFEQNSATIIYEDNQGCIKLAKHSKNHSRTKHIDIKHHFLREKIESSEVKLIYCPTDQMKADILTKALPGPKFVSMREMLGLTITDHSTSGSVGVKSREE